MSTHESHPEVLEALRLLHERVARIEGLHQNALRLPADWNPFSGANKQEIQRLDEMQARIDQLSRAGILHDALDSNLLRLINDLQARVGLPPTPPLPYAPPPPQPGHFFPAQPQSFAPPPQQPSQYFPARPQPNQVLPAQPEPQPSQYFPAQPQPFVPPGYPVPSAPSIPNAALVPPAEARINTGALFRRSYRRFIQEPARPDKTW